MDKTDYHSLIATIGPSGLLRLTMNDLLEVKITCGFDHTLFPFDSQSCYFRYGITEFNANVVVFSEPEVNDWTESGLVDSSGYQFQVTRLAFDKTVYRLPSQQFLFGGRNLSFTGLKFLFCRRSLSYVSGYFVPLFLFVVMSWLSFVIRTEQVSDTLTPPAGPTLQTGPFQFTGPWENGFISDSVPYHGKHLQRHDAFGFYSDKCFWLHVNLHAGV